MLITDQVAIAPCTDCVQARRPTLRQSPVTATEDLDSFPFVKLLA